MSIMWLGNVGQPLVREFYRYFCSFAFYMFLMYMVWVKFSQILNSNNIESIL